MKTLVVIIAGLGSEETDPNLSTTWDPWVKALYFQLVAAIPGVVVLVGNYTDGSLPEKVIAQKQASGCDTVVLCGHSLGGADEVWLQDHVARLGENLTIDILFFLDGVTDLIRHGWLQPLNPFIVLRAIRIYQTAEPIITSNPITFAGGTRQVENMWIGGAPFNEPNDNHEDVAESASVHQFIVAQIAGLE